MQPLDDAQSGTFVHTWFRVAYQRLGLDREAAREKGRSLVEMLRQPAYRVGSMAELRANPLLLTVLCLVYHEDSSLPRSRVRLYERCVKVLLETWRHDDDRARWSWVHPIKADAAIDSRSIADIEDDRVVGRRRRCQGADEHRAARP